ncbi:MAG: hypothetical protein JO222_01210, partial [Frankiales bacterium]|nr:hypothetical protein [Frankiales bacterium]
MGPRRWVGALAVALVAATAPFAHATSRSADRAAEPTGSFTQHTYPASGSSGARDYWLYLPGGRPRALVVFLHGCNMTAEQTAAATRFNDLAARERFAVVYP